MRWLCRCGAVVGVVLLTGCPPAETSRPRPRARRVPWTDPDLARMPRLIPRSHLLAGGGRARVRLSPDGRRVAFLSPLWGRVVLWTLALDGPAPRPSMVGKFNPPTRWYVWAPDGRSLLGLRDHAGDERHRLLRQDLGAETAVVLSPRGVRVQVLRRSLRHPHEVLVRMNQRDRRRFDVYRLDLLTNKLSLDTPNPGNMVGWVPDGAYRIRAGRVVDENGAVRVVVRDAVTTPWRTLRRWPPGGAGWPLCFSSDGRTLYVLGNREHDKLRLMAVDVATGGSRVVFADPRADLPRRVLVSPVDGRLEAVGVEDRRLRWRALTPRVEEDLRRLQRLAGRHRFRVLGRSRDDKRWLVVVEGDTRPGRYYLYERPSRRPRLLFDARPSLSAFRLARTRALSLRARDGLRLPAYLTRPPGRRRQGLPMVVLVHGGPWSRDRWRWQPWVQWLANRGYAVLQVNYRGSRGYGKRHLNAGDREWGRKMQRDLDDAVRWAIRTRLADPRRVAIFGRSYGGYAALSAVTRPGGLYAAAVDVVGPSNLLTLLRGLPAWWAPLRSLFHRRVGHPRRDAALLRARSPYFFAHRVRTPLLVFQGKNDPRVPLRESSQMVAAIRRAGGRVEYVVYPDEGHGLSNPQNRLDFAARTEWFLARHLGGRAEAPESHFESSARER